MVSVWITIVWFWTVVIHGWGWWSLKRALKDSRDIHIRLPQDLYRALEERASSEGVPVSLLIRRILRSALGL